MSHALDFTTGEAAIAYRGQVPWHGFGNVIQDGDSLETIQQKAGLDYQVLASPSMFHNQDGELKQFANRNILYRSDTGMPLDQVSDNKYKIRQPAEILEFFRNLTDHGGFKIEVAGALHDGKKIWALAKREDMAGTIGADIINPYILLLETYDRSAATKARWTTVRVVCQNTLSMSGLESRKSKTNPSLGAQASRRHSQEFDVNGMQLELADYDKAFSEYMEGMKAMAGVTCDDKLRERFFAKLYAPEALNRPEKWKESALNYDNDGVTTNATNVIAALMDLSKDCPGSNLPSAENTLFGALQTVTFYQDHAARTKGNKRWESATIGQGERIKNDAHELALSIL